MSELTRATIPMCPECGAVIDWGHHGGELIKASCDACGRIVRPAYGYHAPDVAGVVRKIRSRAGDIHGRDDMVMVLRREMESWADRLEGRDE